jgi:hypothetical protein
MGIPDEAIDRSGDNSGVDVGKRPVASSGAASKAENVQSDVVAAARRSACASPNSATHPPPRAIGVVAERDFERARRLLPSLREYADYRDWRDEREGHWMGLAIAGVPVPMVVVSLASLAAWRALAAGAPGDETLDILAARIAALRAAPFMKLAPPQD